MGWWRRGTILNVQPEYFIRKLEIGHFVMLPLDYNFQNPSGFWFSCGLELQNVINFPLGLQNWNLKELNNEMNSGSCSQMTPLQKWPILTVLDQVFFF